MKPRAPTEGLQAHVSDLWAARLAVTGLVQPPAAVTEVVAWQPDPADPLERATRTGLGLHGMLEMTGPRQPRARLEVMAAVALRNAE